MTVTDRPDIVARISVEDLAQRAAAATDGTMKRSGNGWMVRCPTPTHEDRTPSCHISTGDGGTALWHCFGCRTGGSIIDLLTATGQANSVKDALAQLQDPHSSPPSPHRPSVAPERLDVDWDALIAAQRLSGDGDGEATTAWGAYLGIRQETLEAAGVHDATRRWNGHRLRVVRHPLRHPDGTLAGWQDRLRPADAKRADTPSTKLTAAGCRWPLIGLGTPHILDPIPGALRHVTICEGLSDYLTVLDAWEVFAPIGLIGAGRARAAADMLHNSLPDGIQIRILPDPDPAGISAALRFEQRWRELRP